MKSCVMMLLLVVVAAALLARAAASPTGQTTHRLGDRMCPSVLAARRWVQRHMGASHELGGCHVPSDYVLLAVYPNLTSSEQCPCGYGWNAVSPTSSQPQNGVLCWQPAARTWQLMCNELAGGLPLPRNPQGHTFPEAAHEKVKETKKNSVTPRGSPSSWIGFAFDERPAEGLFHSTACTPVTVDWIGGVACDMLTFSESEAGNPDSFVPVSSWFLEDSGGAGELVFYLRTGRNYRLDLTKGCAGPATRLHVVIQSSAAEYGPTPAHDAANPDATSADTINLLTAQLHQGDACTWNLEVCENCAGSGTGNGRLLLGSNLHVAGKLGAANINLSGSLKTVGLAATDITASGDVTVEDATLGSIQAETISSSSFVSAKAPYTSATLTGLVKEALTPSDVIAANEAGEMCPLNNFDNCLPSPAPRTAPSTLQSTAFARSSDPKVWIHAALTRPDGLLGVVTYVDNDGDIHACPFEVSSTGNGVTLGTCTDVGDTSYNPRDHTTLGVVTVPMRPDSNDVDRVAIFWQPNVRRSNLRIYEVTATGLTDVSGPLTWTSSQVSRPRQVNALHTDGAPQGSERFAIAHTGAAPLIDPSVARQNNGASPTNALVFLLLDVDLTGPSPGATKLVQATTVSQWVNRGRRFPVGLTYMGLRSGLHSAVISVQPGEDPDAGPPGPPGPTGPIVVGPGPSLKRQDHPAYTNPTLHLVRWNAEGVLSVQDTPEQEPLKQARATTIHDAAVCDPEASVPGWELNVVRINADEILVRFLCHSREEYVYRILKVSPSGDHMAVEPGQWRAGPAQGPFNSNLVNPPSILFWSRRLGSAFSWIQGAQPQTLMRIQPGRNAVPSQKGVMDDPLVLAPLVPPASLKKLIYTTRQGPRGGQGAAFALEVGCTAVVFIGEPDSAGSDTIHNLPLDPAFTTEAGQCTVTPFDQETPLVVGIALESAAVNDPSVVAMVDGWTTTFVPEPVLSMLAPTEASGPVNEQSAWSTFYFDREDKPQHYRDNAAYGMFCMPDVDDMDMDMIKCKFIGRESIAIVV